ncbi:hypothetical protein [Streptomyces rubiginosohelvolus]|uniref:hypothetical protein n=1 Tax=Streptomyces rubiginosohelvolus TaxID=67362 RepID=UPI0036EBE8E7
MSIWAQSSCRSPFAPAPADTRCHARYGTRAARAFAWNFPAGVMTGWVLDTART